MPQTSLGEILRADPSTSPKATPKPKKTGSSNNANTTPKAPSTPAPESEAVTSSPPPDPRFANRELANEAIALVPSIIRYTFITLSNMTGAVVVQNVSDEELDQYSIPGEDFLAMTDAEREKALKDLLWRYWDDHPEKAPKPSDDSDPVMGYGKSRLIPLRLWFPEWWFAHCDLDPCQDHIYWRQVPACQEVVKEEPKGDWLSGS